MIDLSVPTGYFPQLPEDITAGAGAAGLQPALAVLDLKRSFVVVTDQPGFTLQHLAAFSPGQLTDNSRKVRYGWRWYSRRLSSGEV